MILLLLLVITALPAHAEPGRMCSSQKWGHAHCIRPAHFAYDTCNAINVFSARHALDRGFFVRLIWQESRFDPNALSHANARGIAQFIPSTANKRGLQDPYNPADALEHSAQYLAEMAIRYGNEGMAAVGYNGGERRAEGFLEGKGLATETVNYVPLITGLPAETWRDNPPKDHDMRLSKSDAFLTACYALAKKRRITPLVVTLSGAPATSPKPQVSQQTRPVKLASKATTVRAPIVRRKPWGVQVAFATSKKGARAAARRKTSTCRSLVRRQRLDLIYTPHRVATKKGYYFARFGRNSKNSAQKLCNAMRKRQCACRVVQN